MKGRARHCERRPRNLPGCAAVWVALAFLCLAEAWRIPSSAGVTSARRATAAPVGSVAADRIVRIGNLELVDQTSGTKASAGMKKFGWGSGLSWGVLQGGQKEVQRRVWALVLPLLMAVGPMIPLYSSPTPAMAADPVKVAGCLFKNCQLELAKCILDPKCLSNVICINSCNGKPDETECQIFCGNLFENEVVGEFNACALSKKKCVSQKQDDGAYPIPSKDAVVKTFDLNMFDGKWYISAGLNPLFDTFDCQVHFFNIQGDKLYGKLNWRITEPDGEFFTRNTIQRFVQDPQNPGILYNHDNEYLHYQDDWYIVDYVPEEFVAVYYRGQNDAWIGYGGAVVYSREPQLPARFKPRIKQAFARAGVDFDKFKETDNSCSDLSENPTVLRARYAKQLFLTEEKALQESLTAARVTASNAFLMQEKEAQKAFQELEKAIEEEVKEVEEVFEKDVEEIEEEVQKLTRVLTNDVWKVSNQGTLEQLQNKLNARPLPDPRVAK